MYLLKWMNKWMSEQTRHRHYFLLSLYPASQVPASILDLEKATFQNANNSILLLPWMKYWVLFIWAIMLWRAAPTAIMTHSFSSLIQLWLSSSQSQFWDLFFSLSTLTPLAISSSFTALNTKYHVIFRFQYHRYVDNVQIPISNPDPSLSQILDSAKYPTAYVASHSDD